MAMKLSGGNPNHQSWKPNRKEYPEVNAAKARIHSNLSVTSDAAKKASAKTAAEEKKFYSQDVTNIKWLQAQKAEGKLNARKKALQKTVKGFTK